MGGNALKDVSPITQEQVDPTLVHVYKCLPFDRDATVRIGSAGKKKPCQISGDIDIAVDENCYSFDLFKKWLHQESVVGITSKIMDGLKIASVGFPIYTADGEKTDKSVQVDFMFVPNLDIAEYTFYSPKYTESKYKGIYRNELLAALAKVMDTQVYQTAEEGTPRRSYTPVRYSRYQWNLLAGLQWIIKECVPRKDGRGFTAKEVITEKKTLFTDPNDMVRFMFGNEIYRFQNGGKQRIVDRQLTSHDVLTLEQCINIMSQPEFKYRNKLPQILATAIEFYKIRRLGVPEEVLELHANLESTQESKTSTAKTG